jgi:hypothetical protein
MAFENPLLVLGNRTATANYSSATANYRFVTSTSNTTFTRVASSGGKVLGVLLDTPSSGQMGAIQVGGIAKVRCSTSHGAIAVMDKIRSDANGMAKGSTAVGNFVVGRALESIGANTAGLIAVLLTFEGAGSTSAATGS